MSDEAGPSRGAMVAVFDVGTTHVKLSAFLRDGSLVSQTIEANTPLADGPYTHWNLPALAEFLMSGLAALAKLGPISDIVTTTHGASTVMLGEDGPAVPMANYEWDGYGAVEAEYDAVRAPFSQTGSPRLPGGQNVGQQILFAQRTMPDAFAKVRAIVPYPQYWGWWLTGRVAADASSLGAQSDLWAPYARHHSSLVTKMGWGPLMAPVMPADAVLGTLRAEVAARTGLPEATRVRVGIHDSNASILPFLDGRTPPFTVVSSGTWAIIFALGGDPSALDEARDCVVHVNARGEPVPGARLMAGREYAHITNGADAGVTLLDAHHVMVSGTLILPSFVPGVGPFGRRTGEGADDPRLETPGRRRAAASLYAALTVATSMELAGADGPLLIDGPLANDPIVPAALAVLTQRPVEAMAGTGSSLAAATLAGVRPPVRSAPVTPDEAFARAVCAYGAAWRRAVVATE